MELEFSQQFFEKYSNIKFHENPSSGSRVVPCGQRDGRRRTDMTKLIVASCNFANAHNKNKIIHTGINQKYILVLRLNEPYFLPYCLTSKEWKFRNDLHTSRSLQKFCFNIFSFSFFKHQCLILYYPFDA